MVDAIGPPGPWRGRQTQPPPSPSLPPEPYGRIDAIPLPRPAPLPEALTLCTIIAALPAHAKSATKSFTFAVPFDFVPGNRTMPAGTYRFQLVLGSPTEDDTVAVLAVRSDDGRYYVSTLTSVVETEATFDGPKLVFNRTGDRAFLSQLWEQGNTMGLKLNLANETEVAEETEEVLIGSH